MNAEVERKMVIGLIASTDYFLLIRQDIKPELITTPVAKLLAQWCCEYFDKYKKAPGRDIAEIYLQKVKAGRVSKDVAEEIEEDILPELSEEWEEYGINVESLVDSTKTYFREAYLFQIKEGLEVLLEKGDVEEAEKIVTAYKGVAETKDVLILNDFEQLREAVKKAFSEASEPILKYPGALGEFWNSSMVRGGFVALLAPEKRGKTALMIDASIRGVRQKRNVAVFQAGDMTRSQQLRRIAIYLSKNSDKEKYTGNLMLPVKDCYFNQIDDCRSSLRECDFGALADMKWGSVKQARQEITAEDIEEAIKVEPDYKPCHNCLAYAKNSWGMPYLKKHTVKDILTEDRALSVLEQYFCRKNRGLRISTHTNGTLSVEEMKAILNTWEQQDGWVADIIIVDYADLLTTKGNQEERHKQNNIWKALRGLNQETNTLLITATQSDAAAYEQDTLRLKNFSEDKRKYAHVTAFYGLNQDSKGREKKLGLLRINELLLREDGFDANRQVTVLQAMSIGRPILTSYW